MWTHRSVTLRPENGSTRSRRHALVAASLLVLVGTGLLAAVSYAPGMLGVEDESAFVVVLVLRGVGMAALLAAAALIVRSRQHE
jgi:hypothetical protein